MGHSSSKNFITTYQGDGTLSPQQLPIVYDPGYNIKFWGLQRFHPFDSCKYEKVHQALVNFGYITNERQSVSPGTPVSQDQLLKIHSPEYLDSHSSSSVMAEICEMPALKYAPNSIIQSKMLNPMKFAVQGTIVAGELAMKNGWAINLGGGMHHASHDNGGGWCVYSDIFLSFHNLRDSIKQETGKPAKAMIIDLDVHQGDGLAKDKEKFHTKPEDGEVYILDMHNHELWPDDEHCREISNQNIDVPDGETDSAYLTKLNSSLKKAFVDFPEPDIIYYNAGTDILDGDPLNGDVQISQQGVMKRDELVFKAALTRKIPIVMVLSGGYAPDSAEAIILSLKNLLKPIIHKHN